MCGACGSTVVPDPILGPVRTMRQHLIVAQTINEVCRSWAGAPKVVATSGGWLVASPTGATEAVSTVEMLWTEVLRGKPGTWSSDLPDLLAYLQESEAADISMRVLTLGQRLSQELATAAADGPGSRSGP